MAKREPAMTRARLIAALKSRGVRGRLSKLSKPALQAKLRETAPPDDAQEGGGAPSASGLRLEPDAAQEGGHLFKRDGSMGKNTGAKHGHVKSTMPSKPKAQSGGSYRSFVGAQLKTNGGSMAAAAKAWREQKGGHVVRLGGTPNNDSKTNKKSKHTHPGINPATERRRRRASPSRRRAPTTTTIWSCPTTTTARRVQRRRRRPNRRRRRSVSPGRC